MRDMSSIVAQNADAYVRDVVTSDEFAEVAIDNLVADEHCDPGSILAGLPRPAQVSILAKIDEYARSDHFLVVPLIGPYLGDQEELRKIAAEKKPRLRAVCEAIQRVECAAEQ